MPVACNVLAWCGMVWYDTVTTYGMCSVVVLYLGWNAMVWHRGGGNV